MKLPNIVGGHRMVTLTTGRQGRVVLLNNAATTPPFEQTLQEVTRFLQTYSALNRGAGPHASMTYAAVQEAVQTIRRFLGLRDDQVILFTQGATSAINLFARILRLTRQDIVLTSPVEHTSNNLPWLFNTMARIVEIEAFDDGSFDYGDLERKAAECGPRLRVISLNGASNTTGSVPDLRRLSRVSRGCGALFFVDAAQLAPYREINMGRDGIDALAFSAHKIYAPFGTGVLVLPGALLEGCPVDPGGGTVDMVSEWDVLWCPSRVMRHQAGTWNAVGIVALAASCRAIMEARSLIEEHERTLVEYAACRLREVEGLTLYVDPAKYARERRLGVFPFNLEGYHYALLGAVLEHEYGIETRAGTICNHRVVRRWFDVTCEAQKKMEAEITAGNRLASYGIVRASLGVHNTEEDVDLLAGALSSIRKDGPSLRYRPFPEDGLYMPA